MKYRYEPNVVCSSIWKWAEKQLRVNNVKLTSITSPIMTDENRVVATFWSLHEEKMLSGASQVRRSFSPSLLSGFQRNGSIACEYCLARGNFWKLRFLLLSSVRYSPSSICLIVIVLLWFHPGWSATFGSVWMTQYCLNRSCLSGLPAAYWRSGWSKEIVRSSSIEFHSD